MASRWLGRLAVLAGVTLVSMVPAVGAGADDDIHGAALGGPLPVTAAEAQGAGCPDRATGAYPGLDLWKFHVTGDAVVNFVDGDGVPQSRKVTNGEVATPAGWSLVGGTATTDGTTFELAGACAATGGLGWLKPRSPQKTAEASKARVATNALDVGATVTVGSSVVLAGVLLLIVRRRPRGRHRKGEPAASSEVWHRAW